MVKHQVLEQPFRQMRPTKSFGETLTHQQGLRSVFKDDAVASHQRRNDRVDCRQIRVIPRGDHQHRAQRFALDIALETRDRPGLHRCQSFRRNGDHVPRTFFETTQFAGAETHRSTHLPGQFRDDVILHGQHCVHRCAANARAFVQWPAFPLRLGIGRRRQCPIELAGIGAGTFSINPAIDRGDELNRLGHGNLNSARNRAAVPNR
ncbi:hypothetical protein D3C76_1023810 [compost metagenome]